MVIKAQVKKDVIINEICIMKLSRHPNIVNYVDSYLVDSGSTLWVCLTFLQGSFARL
jgi:protein-serine/threonine kinase